ncbi:UDP-2,3-diacylglucosamine diphosphatase [Croceimicrobium hydrocarbonivorans]|uniref:UDP-2,3-diacylglucosamine diphosphatase n=1 Tax=Croceimicrobium hydrocarbonivorans TaxID=2761580 RepID=A0A7H0VJJ9_9FLAO|nr:UDP-2,3-diacylglucosamine diphosphatase [Croceimicrobium hydrocarbonivorans]QNR25897.1 UDP-2,3-diacylglucosamine diphosphatase [Croceimicrobium hydrocarbonivorans]
MQLEPGKKIYFASDLHLGVPDYASSLEREKHFVQWLDHIKSDAAELFLVGDVFDFWFEYRKAVPRGFVRLLGKLAELSDAGIPIHLFTGNHDMWIFDYLPKEIGLKLYREPQEREWNQKRFYIGHGDGLGPGDHGYKFIKKIFKNPFLQWAFARLHPNFGIGLADYFSRSSRAKSGHKDAVFLGEDDEWLAIYAKEMLQEAYRDYFIFGHRHLPLDIQLNEAGSRYINLGDWIQYFTYGVFDGEQMQLMEYPLKGGSPVLWTDNKSAVQ